MENVKTVYLELKNGLGMFIFESYILIIFLGRIFGNFLKSNKSEKRPRVGVMHSAVSEFMDNKGRRATLSSGPPVFCMLTQEAA